MERVRVTSKTVEVRGVTLPWERVERYGPTISPWNGQSDNRQPKGTVLESGEVFIPLDLLYEVSEQDRWSAAFDMGSLCVGEQEKLALVKQGWAEEETRGGVHGTDALKAFLKSEGY